MINGPVFDVSADAQSCHFDDSLENKHWRKQKVEDLKRKMKLLHTAQTYNNDDVYVHDLNHTAGAATTCSV